MGWKIERMISPPGPEIVLSVWLMGLVPMTTSGETIDAIATRSNGSVSKDQEGWGMAAKAAPSS